MNATPSTAHMFIIKPFTGASLMRLFSTHPSKELAQNGRGIKRATQILSEFLCCLAARIRALCASKKSELSGWKR